MELLYLMVVSIYSSRWWAPSIFATVVVRYMNVAYVVKMASISPPVKKRFPTYAHYVECGLLTERETKILEESTVEKPPYVVPLVWAIALCRQVCIINIP